MMGLPFVMDESRMADDAKRRRNFIYRAIEIRLQVPHGTRGQEEKPA
jgi:hypothetical protein